MSQGAKEATSPQRIAAAGHRRAAAVLHLEQALAMMEVAHSLISPIRGLAEPYDDLADLKVPLMRLISDVRRGEIVGMDEVNP